MIDGSGEESAKIPCCVMAVHPRREYAKNLRLSEVGIEIIDQPEDYATYIEGVLRYVRMIEEPSFLRTELDVAEVAPMGDYIRGFFGGEKRKYAGLIIEDFRYDGITRNYHIRLANLSSKVSIPAHFIEDYWKKFIYRPAILPFYFRGPFDILLSDKGENDLRKFLDRFVLNNPSLSPSERDKVRELIKELKQPTMLRLLDQAYYYVIYRCQRAFAAVVITPDDIRCISEHDKYGIVVSNTCAYIVTNEAVKAYYYSGVLNFLLYKMHEYGMSVARDQYARPLAVIVSVGLQWRGEAWQVEVAELSERIHGRAPDYYKELLASGKEQVRLYLRKLYKASEEFRKLVELLDEYVEEERLKDALALVSGWLLKGSL